MSKFNTIEKLTNDLHQWNQKKKKKNSKEIEYFFFFYFHWEMFDLSFKVVSGHVSRYSRPDKA